MAAVPTARACDDGSNGNVPAVESALQDIAVPVLDPLEDGEGDEQTTAAGVDHGEEVDFHSTHVQRARETASHLLGATELWLVPRGRCTRAVQLMCFLVAALVLMLAHVKREYEHEHHAVLNLELERLAMQQANVTASARAANSVRARRTIRQREGDLQGLRAEKARLEHGGARLHNRVEKARTATLGSMALLREAERDGDEPSSSTTAAARSLQTVILKDGHRMPRFGTAAALSLQTVILKDGHRMPRFGSPLPLVTRDDHVAALQLGYRLFHACDALSSALSVANIARADVFVITHSTVGLHDNTESSLARAHRAVSDYGLTYSDLHLLHPSVEWRTTSRDITRLAAQLNLVANSLQHEHTNLHQTLRSIGVSAMSVAVLQLLDMDSIAAAYITASRVATAVKPAAEDGDGAFERLLAICDQRGMVLLSDSPAAAANQGDVSSSWDQVFAVRAELRALARTHNVTATQLLTRYLLQRAIVLIAPSQSESRKPSVSPVTSALAVSTQHFQRTISDFSLTQAEMEMIVDSKGLGSAGGVLGLPPSKVYSRQRSSAHHGMCLHLAHWTSSACFPTVPMSPNAEDPATTSDSQPTRELHAAPRVELVAMPGVDSDPGPISRQQIRAPHSYGAFRLAVVGAAAPASTVGFDDRYAQLVQAISERAGSMLGKPEWAFNMYNDTGPGVQHVIGLKAFAPSRGRPGAFGVEWDALSSGSATTSKLPFIMELRALVDEYVTPFVSAHVFGGRAAWVRTLHISRNMKVASEEARARAMLWHWDALPFNRLKVVIYLTNVPDRRSGCMLAMVHNTTGRTFKLANSPTWGARLTPSNVPKPWLLDLLHQGYRPTCLTGPAGTMLVFDPNIVHRGSRPAHGLYRDSIMLEIVPGLSPKRQALTRRATKGQAEPPRATRFALGNVSLYTVQGGGAGGPLHSLPAFLGLQQMPRVGFGTTNRKAGRGSALERSIKDYVSLGGRLIDTAIMYRNHDNIRRALQVSDVPREQIWIISKVQTDRKKPWFVNSTEGAVAAVDRSLRELGTTYIDVMLIHLPFGNSQEELSAVWRGLVRAKHEGKCRYIGVSNFNREQIEQLAATTGEMPDVNEIEYHPWVSDEAHQLVRWCQRKRIEVVAYGSLGGSKNKARGSAVAAVAARKNVSSAQVLLRWALDHNVRVIPGATTMKHIADNLAVSASTFELSSDDKKAIEQSERPTQFASWRPLEGRRFSTTARGEWTPPCSFNLARCNGTLRVYIYRDEPAIDLHDYMYPLFRTIIDKSPIKHLLVNDPSQACLLIVPAWFPKGNQKPGAGDLHVRMQKLRTLPYWNGGENHLVWDPWDFDKGQMRSWLGSAMLATSSGANVSGFRSACDISIPLWAQVIRPELTSTPPSARSYLLTFRGQLGGNDRKHKATILRRRAIIEWDNLADVRVINSGYLGNDAISGKSDQGVARMYLQLMNTTFALVPGGNQMASHRLTEVMAAGCIPVFVDLEDYVRPYANLIPWEDCSLSVSSNITGARLRELLLDLPKDRLIAMQKCVQKAYDSLLGPDGAGSGLLLSLLVLLDKQHPSFRLLSPSTGFRAGKPLSASMGADDLTHQMPWRSLERKWTWRTKYFCIGALPCETRTSFEVPCLPCNRFARGRTCDFCVGGTRHRGGAILKSTAQESFVEPASTLRRLATTQAVGCSALGAPVLDVGFNLGQDSRKYLAAGLRVVAVEANPALVTAAKQVSIFAKALHEGQLQLLNKAIAPHEGGNVTFWIHTSDDERSSTIQRRCACDFGKCNYKRCRSELVEAWTCARILRDVGACYVKVDIEGSDDACLSTLAKEVESGGAAPPMFVSAEKPSVASLEALQRAGYGSVKCVDQVANWRQVDRILKGSGSFGDAVIDMATNTSTWRPLDAFLVEQRKRLRKTPGGAGKFFACPRADLHLRWGVGT